MKAQVDRFVHLSGWRRWAVALGLGALTGLAFAPLRLVWALAVGLSGLAILLEGSLAAHRPRRAAFWTGTLFGTGYFAVSMIWLANAFLVQADQFAWMIPIVLPGFFAFLGAFYGLASWGHVAIRRWAGLEGVTALLPLVLTLGVGEWLRGHVLTGLPWNLHAQVMAGTTVGLQPLAVLGPYGYGVVLSVLALGPAMVLLHPAKRLKTGVLLVGLTALLASFAVLRLAAHPAQERQDVRVVVVQPNVGQRDKLDPAKRSLALRRSLEMTSRAARSGAVGAPGASTYIVWPENAYPFLHRVPDFTAVLSGLLPPEAWLITGSIREVDDGYANTLFIYGPSGAGSPRAGTYDKHRLVPFGETLPFYSVFEALGLESLSPTGGRGFVPGAGPSRFGYGRAPFSPLICYEDVFPRALFPADQRPDWLVVVTNDAWFGDRAGPLQHLDIARMRAVETGLPLARSANTGISALIDSEGRVSQRLDLYEPGAITALLPVSRNETLYSQYGDLQFYTIMSFIVLLVGSARMQGEIAMGNSNAPRR